jgi:hypothetical protein
MRHFLAGVVVLGLVAVVARADRPNRPNPNPRPIVVKPVVKTVVRTGPVIVNQRQWNGAPYTFPTPMPAYYPTPAYYPVPVPAYPSYPYPFP